jgi:DNA-binding MarR family transcriptional regulator
MADRWLTDSEQQVWRDLLRLQRDLPARLNRQLVQDSGLSGAEYAVLVSLSEAPDQKLRPVGLVDTLDWEQSRVSHQLTRMERRGLIARQECPSDGRGAFVVLTEAGRAAITSAAPGHVAMVRRLIFDMLTDGEVERFGETCAKILQAIDESQPPCPRRGGPCG